LSPALLTSHISCRATPTEVGQIVQSLTFGASLITDVWQVPNWSRS